MQQSFQTSPLAERDVTFTVSDINAEFSASLWLYRDMALPFGRSCPHLTAGFGTYPFALPEIHPPEGMRSHEYFVSAF